VVTFTLIVAATISGPAADWPQWRGPNRDGLSQEKGLLQAWPQEGPKLVWKATDIGSGYSTPSVVGDRLYVLANDGLENEFVAAISASDGKRIWRTRLGNVGQPSQMPNFPAARSTPTVEGAVLYALGSDGDLACLDADSGTIRWRKHLRSDFGGKPGTWAYAESPLIDGDTLVATPGGSEATLIALNKKTGEVIWKSPVPGGDAAAYASALAVEVGGIRQYVQLLHKGLVGVEAKTGKFLWRFDKPVSRQHSHPAVRRRRRLCGFGGHGRRSGQTAGQGRRRGGRAALFRSEPAHRDWRGGESGRLPVRYDGGGLAVH
jgi:outer membrane protein assembly factor BamB